MALFDDTGPGAGLGPAAPTGSGLFDDLPPLPGDFVRGLRSGTAGVKAAGGGLTSLVGRAIGSRGLEDRGAAITDAASAEAARYARRVEDVGGLGEGVDFAQYAIGSALPSMLTALAGAALGRGIGGLAARRVSDEATRGLLRQSGLAGGALAGTVGLEAGSIFPEAVEQGVDSPIARSLVGGLAAGALDVLPDVYLARRLGLLGAGRQVQRTSRLAGAATQGAKVAGFEAATETGQSLIERLAAGQELDSEEAYSDYLNSFAVGGIAGAGFGGAVGAIDANPGAAAAPAQQFPPAQAPAAAPAPVVLPGAAPEDVVGAGAAAVQPEAGAQDLGFPPIGDPVQFPDLNFPVDQSAQPVDPRIAAADAELAANPERMERQFLERQRNTVMSRIEALRAEMELPAGQRGSKRTKSAIAKQLIGLRAELDGLNKKAKKARALEAARIVPKTGTATGQALDLSPETPPQRDPVSPFELDTLQRAASEAPGFDRTAAELAVLGADAGVVQPSRPQETPQDLLLPEARTPRSRIVYDAQERAAEQAAIEADAAARLAAERPQRRPYTETPGQRDQAAVDALTLQLAERKRASGELLSASEAKALRDAERRQGEAQAAPAPAIAVPEASRARQVLRQGTPQQKREAFINESSRVVDSEVQNLVAQNVAKPAAAKKAATKIKAALETMLAAPNPEAAQTQLREAVSAAFRGHVRKSDVDIFADMLVQKLGAQPQTFLSRGAVNTTPVGGTKVWYHGSAAPVVGGFRTTSRSVNTTTFGQVDTERHGVFMSDSPEFSAEYGPVVSGYRVDVSNTAPVTRALLADFANTLDPFGPERGLWVLAKNTPPGWQAFDGDLGARFVQYLRQRGFDSASFIEELERADGSFVEGRTLVVLDPARISQAPQTFLSQGSVDVQTGSAAFKQWFDGSEVVAVQGRAIMATLDRMIGGAADVEVRLFEQKDPNGFAGRYRATQTKDIIEIAYNAKDALSTAAHEAFHRIETRHLTGQERAVLRRGLAKNTALFKSVVERARRYDADNKTHTADDIEAIPQEAHAYAFEMWKRGDLEAQGALAKVFTKIRRLLERIRNYIDGLGFQSVEDLFDAVDRGAYATSPNPLLAVDATKAYSLIDTEMFSRAHSGPLDGFDPLKLAAISAGAADGQTESAAFKEWFGESKVVDENGRPMVMYHGTDVDFGAFNHAYTSGQLGFHFGTAEQAGNISDDATNMVPAYLAIRNPIRLEDLGAWQGLHVVEMVNRIAGTKLNPSASDRAIRRALEELGYDGVVYTNGFEAEGDSYIAFRPEQIKSAVGNRGTFDPNSPNILHSRTGVDAVAVQGRARASDAGHRREKMSGRYVGAPDWVGGSPQQLAVLRRKLRQLAQEGEPGRYWYEASSRAILDLVGGSKAEGEKLVALIAIYSPNSTVPGNTTAALTAYFQHKTGRPIKAGFSRANEAAQRVLDGTATPDETTGIKRNSFYQNLMVEIDPSKLDPGVATMDMWMALAFDYGARVLDSAPSRGDPGGTKYRFAEIETRRLAAELGWPVHQVQAAMWTAMKGRIDPIRGRLWDEEVRRGWVDFTPTTNADRAFRTALRGPSRKEVLPDVSVFSLDPDAGLSKEYEYRGRPRALIDYEGEIAPSRRYDHYRLAHEMGMKYDLAPEDIAASRYDFSRAIRDRFAHVSWSVAPGPSTGQLSGFDNAPLEQKLKYLEALDKVLFPGGRDLVADLVGLPPGTSVRGLAAVEGDVAVGGQAFTAVPSEGSQRTRDVRPEARQLLSAYAAARAYILSLDSVGWQIPIYDDAAIRHNAAEMVGERPVSRSEMALLYRALYERFGNWSVVPSYTTNGVRVQHDPTITGVSNKAFQEAVREIVADLPAGFAGGDARVVGYRAGGEILANNWKEDTNGEVYRDRFAAGRPDILERADVLRARVQALNGKFARKYGWDSPDVRGGTAGGGASLRAAQEKAVRAAHGERALEGLPDAPLLVSGRWHVPGPYAKARDVARKYMEEAGLSYIPPRTYAAVDPARARRIADAYAEMPHAPNDPVVQAAYEALASETVRQYSAVIDSGLKVEFIDPGKGDPYADTPRGAIADIIENNHLWVFSTRDGFGSNAAFNASNNPLLRESGFTISGRPALVNDLFRVVHDYFGHAKEGVGFRATGEENAWRAHSSMYSPAARRAMTTETRGQNSWVNYGPNGETNRKANAAVTTYADQKTGLLPDWVVEEGATDDVQTFYSRGAVESAALPVRGDGMVELTHWSDKHGLAVLDPQFHDTGIRGAEASRRSADPDNYVPRTYYGIGVGSPGGYVKEPGLGPVEYKTAVRPNDLYDFAADPFKLRAKAARTATGWDNPVSLYERYIKEAGFVGYWSRSQLGKTAAVFEPLSTRADSTSPGEISFLSRAAIQDIVQRAQDGEIERTQLMATVAKHMDDSGMPAPTWRALLGAGADGLKGGLARAYLTHVSSGMNIARQSKGFKNTFDTVTAYEQRKNRMIADGVDVQMSKWLERGVTQQDISAAGKALLDRTAGGFRVGSPEYFQTMERLTTRQKEMFAQATSMIADRLDAEFVADQRTMADALGVETEAYTEWLENRRTQVQRLKDEGYVPERRYGDHVVHVSLPITDAQGRQSSITVMQEQFESEAQAKLRLKQFQEVLGPAAPELKIGYGYRYKAEHDASMSYQQFLDTARRLGIEVSQTEKERLAKAMVSADSVRRNRIFRRSNVPGYSEDAMRVLSEFAVTMANKIAYSEFSSAIGDAQRGRPVSVRSTPAGPQIAIDQSVDLWEQDGENSGFYRNLTDKMTDFVLQPQTESSWSNTARGLAAMHFLGGSFAAGAVQLSALPMISVPTLSAHTGYTNALGKVLSGLRDVVTTRGIRDLAKLEDENTPMPAIDAVPGLRAALVRAGQDGTTLDTEIYQIMGMTRGGLMSKSRNVRRAVEGWMAPFRITEQTNRAATFIAAYKVGIENKLSGDALYQFAQKTVYDTQFRYDEANRPALARNPIWAILFVFKSFPIFMTEAMVALAKENKTAAVYMLLSLAVASGVNGMPFSEDIGDIIDTISQRVFGSPFNTQRAMRNVLKSASEAVAGADLSGVFMNGLVNELTGLSFASRVGMGNLVPGTRLGAADSDYARLTQEMLGPVGSMVTGAAKAAESLTKGDWVKAIRQGAPLAIQNASKGIEQWTHGHASDVRGRKLVDASGPEAILQALGFSSKSLNNAYQLDRIDRQTVAFYRMAQQDFMNDIVAAVRDKDTERIREVLGTVQAWNTAHPDMVIAMSPSAVRRTVAEAGLPINQRTLLALPRALRGGSEAFRLAAE